MTEPLDPRHPRAQRAAVALYAPVFRWRLQQRRGARRLEAIARALLAYSTHGHRRRP